MWTILLQSNSETVDNSCSISRREAENDTAAARQHHYIRAFGWFGASTGALLWTRAEGCHPLLSFMKLAMPASAQQPVWFSYNQRAMQSSRRNGSG